MGMTCADAAGSAFTDAEGLEARQAGADQDRGADRATATWAIAELVAELVVNSRSPAHVVQDFERIFTALARIRWDARNGETPALELRRARLWG
jgi:hypothetical protein